MTGSERPRDKGGSHPERQRKRTELVKPRRSLLAMLASVAIAATAGVVLRGSDARLGEYLGGSAKPVVAILVAATQALAAVLLVMHAARGRLVALIAASFLILAAVGLLISINVAWLPAVLIFVGFIELLLVAGSTPRKPARRKHLPGR
jgi:hypothetical protein